MNSNKSEDEELEKEFAEIIKAIKHAVLLTYDSPNIPVERIKQSLNLLLNVTLATHELSLDVIELITTPENKFFAVNHYDQMVAQKMRKVTLAKLEELIDKEKEEK